MAAIDAGITNNPTITLSTNYTYLELSNVADGTGILDTVRLYGRSCPYGSNAYFGTLYGTKPTYTGRDSVYLGWFYAGVNTYTGLSVDVEENDVIGAFLSIGMGGCASIGNNAQYGSLAGNCLSGSNTFDLSEARKGRAFSLYASGETVEAGAIPQMLVSM